MSSIIKPWRLYSVMIVYTMLYGSWLLLWRGDTDLLTLGGNLFSTLGSIAASLLLLRAWRLAPRDNGEQRLWLFLFVGSLFYVIAEVVWLLYENVLHWTLPYPGPPDLFYILHVVCFLIGFGWRLLANARRSQRIQHLLDIAIIMVAAISFSLHFLIEPNLDGDWLRDPYHWVYIGYPIGDLGLLLSALTLYFGAPQLRAHGSWLPMLIGLLVLVTSDSVYMYMQTANVYQSGSLVDPFFMMGLLSIAVSGSMPRAQGVGMHQVSALSAAEEWQAVSSRGFTRIIAPHLSIIMLIAAVVLQGLEINWLTIGAVLSIVLVSTRQMLTMMDNNRLMLSLLLRSQQLTLSTERYHSIFNNYPEPVFSLDLDGRIQAVNPACSSLTEYTMKELSGRTFRALIDPKDHKQAMQLLHKAGHSGPQHGQLSMRSRSGRTYPLSLTLIPIIIDERTVGLYAVGKDITEALRSEEKISDLANHLPLTGLVNRSYLDNGLKQSIREGESQSARRLLLEKELRTALRNQELHIHYQLQVLLSRDRQTRELIGAEALLRWEHPVYGAVGPSEIIPIAEQTGLIVPISEWLIRQVCEQARILQLRGCPLKLGVNLSPQHFYRTNVADVIRGIVEETGIEPSLLELEITEDIVLRDMDKVIYELTELKEIGVHVSLDDFGTGYSSLSYLTNLPISTLKIDRHFVRGLGKGAANDGVISMIVTMAASMGLQVIAEGVETEQQSAILLEMQCTRMQGYLFGEPVPASTLQAMLERDCQCDEMGKGLLLAE
ncbi:DUF4084 domain-containing protein [Paenibacillus sp. YYML68]|uniref:DUF4084 domain-containing protein n=1 Tax=Paenibacillus sp. YYML68 TaxID=2909250 RepID=UPI0024934941|nr:DUF4084 domain-containing protein [Paenibacillus sp. YYML68]